MDFTVDKKAAFEFAEGISSIPNMLKKYSVIESDCGNFKITRIINNMNVPLRVHSKTHVIQISENFDKHPLEARIFWIVWGCFRPYLENDQQADDAALATVCEFWKGRLNRTELFRGYIDLLQTAPTQYKKDRISQLFQKLSTREKFWLKIKRKVFSLFPTKSNKPKSNL